MTSGQSALPPESALLGDSWVVPDIDTFDNQQNPNPGPPTKQNGSRSRPRRNVGMGHSSESTRTLESSIISGPALIMPSIYDSEASWVVPSKLSQSSSSNISRSDSEALPERIRKRAPKAGSTEIPISDSDVLSGPAPKNSLFLAKISARSWGSRFKIALGIGITLLLLASIPRFTILRILTQLPTICLWPTVPEQHSDSASSGTATHGLHTSLERHQRILESRSQLENTLQWAVQELTTVGSGLRRNDHSLHALYNNLHTTTYSRVKNELDLEFQGARAALRTALKELDTLKLVIKSTVDSLPNDGRQTQTNPTPATEHKIVERKGLSWCLSWLSFHPPIQSSQPLVSEALTHQKLLDMVAPFFGPRLNSLLRSLAALDDHLQCIQKVTYRAENGGNPPSPLRFLASVFKEWVSPAFHFSIRTQSQSQANLAHEPLLDLLHDSASHNQSVNGVVLGLTKQLETLQREQHVSN
ncbi:hypothetical protein V8E54_015052 [Elaphomyces granulatus]